MGTTCASFHVLWRGSVDDAAKAISRAIVHPMHHIGKQVQPTISLVARRSGRPYRGYVTACAPPSGCRGARWRIHLGRRQGLAYRLRA